MPPATVPELISVPVIVLLRTVMPVFVTLPAAALPTGPLTLVLATRMQGTVLPLGGLPDAQPSGAKKLTVTELEV